MHPLAMLAICVLSATSTSHAAALAPRSCTGPDCGWQWMAETPNAAYPYFMANSWSLPTSYFLKNGTGRRTLNTKCVRVGALEFEPNPVPKGSEYVWEQWPLGTDGADSCCLQYFSSADCSKADGEPVKRCLATYKLPHGQVAKTKYNVRSFKVYGCTGLWTGNP